MERGSRYRKFKAEGEDKENNAGGDQYNEMKGTVQYMKALVQKTQIKAQIKPNFDIYDQIEIDKDNQNRN